LSIFKPSWLEVAVTGQFDVSPADRFAELALIEPEPDALLPA